MTTEEKAKRYALDSLKDKIKVLEQNYLNQVEEDNKVKSFLGDIDNMKKSNPVIASNFFHDLELPSGNRWIFFPSIRISHEEMQSLDLPSGTDFCELFDNCRFSLSDSYPGIKTDSCFYDSYFADIKIKTKSGKEITFYKIPCDSNSSISFWTSSPVDINGRTLAYGCNKNGGTHLLECKGGEFLPLAIVLKKSSF